MPSPTTERSDGVVLLRPHEVEVAVARLLRHWPSDREAGAAMSYLIAARLPGPAGQDDRLAVPDFLAEWGHGGDKT